MRAMNMNGDYSYDEYEKVLENKRTEINAFIGSIRTALAEYRENYRNGSVKAKIAHDKLNKLLDDDSKDQPLGDLLLKQIKEEMSEEKYAEVTEYFEQHKEISFSAWTLAGAKYQILSETKLDDMTLADIVAGEKLDLNDPDDRMELYPIVDAMSEGQRALLHYVDIGEMLLTGRLDDTGWKNAADTAAKELENTQTVSVYSDIDRSMFDPAGVALTSEARRIQSSTGSGYSSRLFGIDTAYIQYAGYGTAAVLLGAGVGSFIRSSVLEKAIDKVLNDKAKAQELIDKMNYAEQKAAYSFHRCLDEYNYSSVGDVFTKNTAIIT